MSDLWAIFEAGRARRWHRHPVMADFDDRLDAHQGRVARLAMALFPGDVALVEAALTHDDGESVVGDVPSPVKNRMAREARVSLDQMEAEAVAALWTRVPGAGADPARLRLCDKLDAIMWAASKAPRLLRSLGWQADMAEVRGLAEACLVDAQVEAVLRRCERLAHD